MNKLIVILVFISFLSSLNLVYGLSDSDFMQRYPTCEKLKSALNTGEIFWSDLTSSQSQAAQTQCQLTPDVSNNSIPAFNPFGNSLIFIIILPIVLIALFTLMHRNSGRAENYSEEKTSNKTEDKVTKISMDSSKTKEEHPMGDKTHD